MRLLAASAALLVAVALAAGCGGDDESSGAETWADGVCGAVSTWTSALTSATDSLRSGPSTDALESAVDDVKSATSTLADDLKSLGAPDTESGQQAKETLDGLADDLRKDVDEIESAASDSSGVSGALSAVSTITGTLATMGSQVGTAMSSIEQLDAKGELTDAFENASSCQDLTETNS